MSQLDLWSSIRLRFWSRLFVWSSKLYRYIWLPQWWFNLCDRGIWKQIRKLPK